MPDNDEKLQIKEHFYTKFRLPGVIGCVDGTHIAIRTPSAEERPHFYNRKGFYSLNTMVVCDHKMRIRSIDPRYPGSCHDSLIWRSSDIRSYLQAQYNNGEHNTWLLGDAGYPLEPFLITPYRSAGEGTHQSTFNKCHSRARNVVERTIGVMKNRFRCLLSSQRLMYDFNKAKSIINICAALYNICIHLGEVAQETTINEDSEETSIDTTSLPPEDLTAANIRNSLMNTLIN
ncbi:putative nuclease HARBI1 [Rhagoletis pomonella]|uniref:putative nuclease HARBI1 n=1 Tax=Rhagoletis pomonella TaxID=28610 RepID=UPI0017840403|nr:putative nuclease HARBI1 [Rhagoletis pomonella]